MLLTILIPTYNRSRDLLHNLSLLEEYILNNSLEGACIIISNNCSTDDTLLELNEFVKNTNINIELYNQNINIGLEKNALFVLSKSTSEYVMFLGDDDFLDEEYFIDVYKIIQQEKDINCIIPSFVGVDSSRSIIYNVGRDLDIETKRYKKGFNSCLRLSYRGHQLSGLVLKREGLYDEYIKNRVHNIYPFIYFVSFSILNGNAYHLTDHPVKVTQITQEKKDWGYGDDGLISEIFDNYKHLNLVFFQRSLLELWFLRKQPRYMMYFKPNKKKWIKAIYLTIIGENTSFITRFTILPLVVIQLISKTIKKGFSYVFSKKNINN